MSRRQLADAAGHVASVARAHKATTRASVGPGAAWTGYWVGDKTDPVAGEVLCPHDRTAVCLHEKLLLS